MIFWRRVIFVLKCMKLHNKDLFDHRIGAMDSSMDATSEDQAEGQVQTYPVSDKETCIRGRESPRTLAGAAFSAQDISVSEVRQPSVAKCCKPDNKKKIVAGIV